jgi:hypothetical protein
MSRPVLYVFSKSSEIKDSLSRFMYHAGRARGLKYDFDPEKNALAYSFVEEITTAFKKESPKTLMHTVAVLDVSDIKERIPLDEIDDKTEERQLTAIASCNSSWTDIAFLILAYPEVFWIIVGAIYNKPANDKLSWCREHFVDASDMTACIKLLERHQNGYRPLFDPSGLRNLIKLNTLANEEKDAKDQKSTPDYYKKPLRDRKKQCAVSIDEETPYVFLNGYTAYRFGYRCYTVMSLKEMKEPKEVHLTMEDLDLRFEDMDKRATDKYREADDRPSYLKNAERFYVTGVANEKEKGKHGKKIIDKPYSGIYDLAQRLGIFPHGNEKSKSLEYLSFRKQLRTQLADLKQHDVKKRVGGSKDDDKKDSHSPANRLLIVTEILLERSQTILKEITDCQSAVLGAVLALEAKEILHGLSMTTSLQALSLQHQFEVLAECSFYGVGAEIKTDERFNELAMESDKAVRLEEYPQEFHSRLAKSFNSQIEIANNIRLIFKEYEQFDEEDRCIDKIRHLMQGLHWFQTIERKENCNLTAFLPRCRQRVRFFGDAIKNSGKSILLFFKYPKLVFPLIEKYFVWLVSSPLKLIASIFFWIFIFYPFYSLYMFCNNMYVREPWSIDLSAFWQSALTFFEMQPANVIEGKGVFFNLLTLVELLLAYVHLGIFISYLYQKLSRR